MLVESEVREMRLKGQLTEFQFHQLSGPIQSAMEMLEQINKEESNCYKLLEKAQKKLDENYYKNKKL